MIGQLMFDYHLAHLKFRSEFRDLIISYTARGAGGQFLGRREEFGGERPGCPLGPHHDPTSDREDGAIDAPPETPRLLSHAIRKANLTSPIPRMNFEACPGRPE